jgi:hypothetical protein
VTYRPDSGKPEQESVQQAASAADGNGHANGNGEVEDELLREVEQAIEEQLARDSSDEPGSPPPLEVGPQRALDSRLWGPGLGEYLEETVGDRDQEQQGTRTEWDADKYRRALKSAFTREFPRPGP